MAGWISPTQHTLTGNGGKMILPNIDPLIAGGVVLTTAVTDAVYVLYTASVAARRRFADSYRCRLL